MNWGLYFYLARRWLLLAVLPALAVAVLSYLYVRHEPNVYTATATVYVQAPSDSSGVSGGTDVYTSQALIPTYSQMIGSPVIAKSVDRALSARYPGYGLESHGISASGAGSVAGQTNTQLMNVTVSDTVPTRAAAAANAAARALITQVVSIQKARFQGGDRAIQRELNLAEANIQDVSQRMANYRGSQGGLNNLRAQLNAYQSIYQSLLASRQEFDLGRDTALNGLKIFSPATPPSSPIGPHPTRTALLYGFLALMVCAGAIFAYDYFDDTPRTPEEIEQVLLAPVLGTVQQFDPAKYGTMLVTASHGRSPIAEAYRVIRTNIQFINVDTPVRTVVVTSASPSEGKTTTVSNLANVFAEGGRRVTLVDADLRRPGLHRVFEAERLDGLTNMLVANEDLNGHGQRATQRANLALITSGPLPPRPADLLGSGRMRELVDHLAQEADLVLLDSPPVLAVTDASVLATITDGVIVVVDPARSKRRDLQRTREAIEGVGGNILGIVINRLTKAGSTYYYYYYQHNYGYQYRYSYGYAARAEPESSEAKS